MTIPQRTVPQLYVSATPDGASGPAVRMDLVERTVSLKYEDTEKKADKLTLTLDNYDLSLFDDPVFRKGMEWEVSWGYPGNMSPVRRVTVTGIKGDTQLVAEAHVGSLLLNLKERTRSWSGVRRSDVVRAVALGAGYGSAVQHVEDTKVVHSTIHQARLTDAQFLRRLATLEGFEFYVDFDGLHFHRRKVGQAPVRVLRYFTAPVVGEVMSFYLENDVLALHGRTRLKGRDPLERKDFEGRGDTNSDPERRTLSSVKEVVDPEDGGTRMEHRMGSEEVRPTSSADAASAQREAQGRFEKAQQDAVKLKLTLVGDPLLLAKTVVEVHGLGKRLSGRYYVRGVTHEISAGSGYQTQLEVVSDGTGGHSTESVLAKGLELLDVGPSTKGKPNTEPVRVDDGELEPYEVPDEETGQTRIAYRPKRGGS